MYLKNTKTATGDSMEFLLRDGKIFALGTDLSAAVLPQEEVLDAQGKTILPAFIDLHCHWRTPGFEYKEDLATGSAAAAAGGYTYVNLMPNTKPVCSGAAQAANIAAQVEEIGLCSANQVVSITQNFDGTTLDHLKSLPTSVRFLSEDGHGVQNASVMAKAFAIAQQKGMTIMSHAEVSDISPWDYRLAEDLETVRNLYLAEYYGTSLHMCHVSTRGAIEAIAAAKWKGVPVTCEATPHHLCFDVSNLDTRVNPPIRTEDDCNALLEGIRSGAVDAIATDHAPHSEDDKLAGAPGMVGLESAFGLCYTKLCKNDGISLSQLSALMSTNPAAILGLNKGCLAPGFDADVVLVDLDNPYVVDKNELHSKSKNCPFDGIALFGKVCTTIKGGKVTYQA